LPAGQFESARVALFPFAHIFRAGSRVRVSVEAPNGNRPFWSFTDLPANGVVVNEIAHSVGHQSQVVLPVIPNPPAGIPAAYPACGSLRGQPCRATSSNGTVSAVSATPQRHDTLLRWTPGTPRAGDTLGWYHIVEQPGGVIHDIAGASATHTTFTALADGPHSFDVHAIYVSGGDVASTPSNTVTLPNGRPEHKPHRPHRPHRLHTPDVPASGRAGTRF
jgi:hypothetical protein